MLCCSSAPPSHELHPIRPLLRPRARAYFLDSFEGYIRLRPRSKYVSHLGYIRSVCAVIDALGRWRSSTEGSRILTITLLATGVPNRAVPRHTKFIHCFFISSIVLTILAATRNSEKNRWAHWTSAMTNLCNIGWNVQTSLPGVQLTPNRVTTTEASSSINWQFL